MDMPALSNQEWSMLLEHCYYLTRDQMSRDRLLARIQSSLIDVMGCSRMTLLLGNEEQGSFTFFTLAFTRTTNDAMKYEGFAIVSDSAQANKVPMQLIDAVKSSKVGVVLNGHAECIAADEAYFSFDGKRRLSWAACWPLMVESLATTRECNEGKQTLVGLVYIENCGSV